MQFDLNCTRLHKLWVGPAYVLCKVQLEQKKANCVVPVSTMLLGCRTCTAGCLALACAFYMAESPHPSCTKTWVWSHGVCAGPLAAICVISVVHLT